MTKWICLAVLIPGVLLAAWAAAPSAPSEPPTRPPSQPAPAAVQPTTAVQAAHALSTITGVAISPLLGVSAVGAWTYLHTAPEQRSRMPWYGQPWFWIPGLLVVSVCFAKDVMGPAVPLALKKPMDALEVFENKLSGLIAAGAFVPLVATLFHAAATDGSWRGDTGLAMANATGLLNLLTVPLAIVCFALVWMVSHVINVLIVVSPFATVDAVLKSARLFLLSTVTMTAFANPYLGAAWALGVIVAAYFLAGWSFRLMVFGTVFAFDLLTFRHARFTPKPDRVWAFTACKLGPVPVRTYGRLARDQAQLVLRYRPWLLLSARTCTLPPGPYAVGRGLFNPELIHADGAKSRTLLLLPPRCRTHEETLAQLHGLGDVRNVGVVKGVQAVWQWLKALFGYGSQPTPPAV